MWPPFLSMPSCCTCHPRRAVQTSLLLGLGRRLTHTHLTYAKTQTREFRMIKNPILNLKLGDNPLEGQSDGKGWRR